MKLSTKISLLTIVTFLIAVAALGFYFDTFLKQQYFQDTKKKIVHAQERLGYNFKQVEKGLHERLDFLKDETNLMASLELINNYQDKQHYNVILLDEEKKTIVSELLERVKSAFYNSGVIYDKNGDLVVFVFKEHDVYRLNFISYKKGKVILYSRLEEEKEFHKIPFSLPFYITKQHIPYYTQAQLHKGTVLTSLQQNNIIYITGHRSVFDLHEDGKTIYHIELGMMFDAQYFFNLSKELGVKIAICKEKSTINTPSLFSEKLKNQYINEDASRYYVNFLLDKQIDPIFITVSLGKHMLQNVLNKNREGLVVFVLVSIVVLLGVFHILLHFGLSKPLEELMQRVQKIERGDYTPSKPIKTGDEIERVSTEIEALALAVNNREYALKESKKELEYLSTHDSLTGLFNRRSFFVKLEYALTKAKRKASKIALLFLDLDEFKQINDTLGHDTGDKLLQAVTKRLKGRIRESDLLARLGGDEFVICIDDFKHINDVQIFADKILEDFKEPFSEGHNEIISATSIGIAIYPDDGEDEASLLKNADLAMYKAKDNGKNNYCFYAQSLSIDMQARMNIVSALKDAIKNESEFVLYYQPKVSIKTQKVVGVEALIRWNSQKLGFVRPDEFIKIAEETHLIVDIGAWVLKQACLDFMTLKNSGYNLTQMSVNCSAIQLEYSDMFQTLQDVIEDTNISIQELEIEVTESYIATNEKNAIATLQQLREMGLSLAIDDFGTGYSSMSYLQKLPVTRLKVDKAFVDDLPDSKESVAVVNAILSLAETFGFHITVEGVEKEEQLEFFKGKYCDDIQGYIYSKPLPFDELKVFMEANSDGEVPFSS